MKFLLPVIMLLFSTLSFAFEDCYLISSDLPYNYPDSKDVKYRIKFCTNSTEKAEMLNFYVAKMNGDGKVEGDFKPLLENVEYEVISQARCLCLDRTIQTKDKRIVGSTDVGPLEELSYFGNLDIESVSIKGYDFKFSVESLTNNR